MSTDLAAIMRRDERRRKMLNDPDLTEELLLFALCLDEMIDIRRADGRMRKRPGHWVIDVMTLAFGEDNSRSQLYRGKAILLRDVPRYEPVPQPYPWPCVAPMVRREGLCRKSGSRHLVDRDPLTGESRQISLCSRHRGLAVKFEAREREWKANGSPLPPANAGGVLKRHFAANWDYIYRWAGREPMEGGREATPPRPRLRLIQGGEDAS